MLTFIETLPVATALLHTVREKIQFSANLDAIFSSRHPLDYMRYKMENDRFSIYQESNSSGQRELRNTCLALERGIGNCGELSSAVLLIAKYFNVSLGENFFLSKIRMDSGHNMVLLHQESKYRNTSSDSYSLGRFRRPQTISPPSSKYTHLKDIVKQGEFSNSIIIDPWIYKVTKIDSLQEHIEQAVDFDVYSKWYDCGFEIISGSTIECMKSGHRIINLPVEHKATIEKSLSVFNKYYEDHEHIIKINRTTVIQNLEFKHIKYMDSLLIFINSLIRSTSFISNLRYGKKQHIMQSTAHKIQYFKEHKYYPSNDTLKGILLSVLRILPLIRGRRRTPIDSRGIHITDSLRGLMRLSVLPEEPYEFESLSNELNLDWLREIRRHTLDNVDRYLAIIKKLYSCCEEAHEIIYSEKYSAFYYSALQNKVSINAETVNVIAL